MKDEIPGFEGNILLKEEGKNSVSHKLVNDSLLYIDFRGGWQRMLERALVVG